jgi:hypothetical protein
MAKDFYHNIVKNALIKDGWRITHDPYKIKIEEIGYEIDLGAEPIIAAEKEEEIIAVEIKSFVGPSNINEFHRAIGQFIDYSIALEEEDPNRMLFTRHSFKKTLFVKPYSVFKQKLLSIIHLLKQ